MERLLKSSEGFVGSGQTFDGAQVAAVGLDGQGQA